VSTLKSSAEHLTLNADGSGNDIKFQSNATEVAAIDQAGNLTLSGTVDGVDIQTLNTAVAANTAKTGITSGQASAITANTAKVTNSTSASDLSSGTLPDARFPSTLPAISGANLTNIDAAIVSTTAPSSPAAGDMWFDSTAGTTAMKVYNGTAWDQMSNKFAASGGTESISGSYKYHTFTSSGTFTAESSGSVDVLIIAGGGGGAGGVGGGGGAGGYISTTGVSVTAQGYSIVIGAGGNGAPRVPTTAYNGGNSSALGSTAIGGGAGGGDDYAGIAGGSGGGASDNNRSGGAGTSGQGNRGGNTADDNSGGAGGGGAGSQGTDVTAGNYSSTSSHLGGTGSTWSDGTVRASGGSGKLKQNGNTTGPVAGGGGAGGSVGTNGSANTGGGGGGNGETNGKNGGSGIVIIRYAF